MRKASKKITRSFLAAALMIPTFSAPVLAEETPQPAAAEYTIYPTPQSIVYTDGTSSLGTEINVVYSASVDEFTKDHAEEVLSLLGDSVTITEGSAAVSGKTNVLIGVEGDNSAAETYFDTHTIAAADLFDKTDAYALDIADGQVVILGASADAAFFGLSSLKHIINQSEGGVLRNLRMEDYADVKTRGFIEGYYGNPWSHEDRMDLMRFGGDYKLNGYFYAPKDDPKHNKNWRELYTSEELEKHRELAQAGNESKCYYIYALHPLMYSPISFGSSYNTDLQIIKDKFEQMMSVGVKQFAILGDDAGVPGNNAQNYVTLMTDLTNWLKTKEAEYPGLKTDMIFCPNDYMGNGSSSQMQTIKALPDSVSIIQTGGRIWGEVGPTFNDPFYEKMGRPAFMWINWPCSDNTKNGLIMGGAEAVLKPGTNPSTVNGIVLNPMQQSEPSKQALFTNADYAWKIWDKASHYDQVWNDSFAFIDHGTIDETAASNAYRELSKHMKNSQQIGNEESEEIKDAMSAIRSKLNTNQPVPAADIAAMKAEFTKLAEAAKTYRAQTGNERTLSQIHYWIDSFEETANAINGYLDSLTLLDADADVAEIWDRYASAQDQKAKSESHGFHYVDHDEYARPGRRHIYPFMTALDEAVSAKVLPLVNPNILVTTYITSRSDSPEGNVDNVFDGSASTQIIYKNPNTLSADDYVGVLFSRPEDLNEVQFLLGQSGNLNDTFTSAIVQVSYDGETWQDLGSATTSCSDIHLTDMNVKAARGIRVKSTAAKSNTWLGVRDIRINPAPAQEAPGDIPSSNVTLATGCSWYQGNASNLEDDSLSTIGWVRTPSDTAATGVFLTKTYDSPFVADAIHIAMGLPDQADKLTHYSIEVSADGTNWEEVRDINGAATGQDNVTIELNKKTIKAIRINNKTSVNKWVKIAEFKAIVQTEENAEALYSNKSGINAKVLNTASGMKLVSKDGSALTLGAGEYAGMDFGHIVKVPSLTAPTLPAGVRLEVSRNSYEWTESTGSAAEGIRYVRVINTADAAASVDLSTPVEAVIEEARDPYLESDTIGLTTGNWAGEDSRNNGAAFDGDVNTTTEFANLPAQGAEIVYNLGTERSIRKLEIFNQDSTLNYIRDAKIQVSLDKENWTDVVTIGDGVENTDDGDTTCINSDAGYRANSTYPNKVSIAGELETPVQARYLRIYFTAANNNRAVLFNEIMINDGEFVPVDDKAVTTENEHANGHAYSNMLDGDLTTSYKPAGNTAGSMQYDFSDAPDANSLNIVSKGTPSNATVTVRCVNAAGVTEWKDLGVLDRNLMTFADKDIEKILSVKLTWTEGNAPEIQEVIRFTSVVSDLDFSQLRTVYTKAKAEKDSFANASALTDPLAQAKTVLDSAESQEQINNAAQALNQALLDMRYAPDKDKLSQLD